MSTPGTAAISSARATASGVSSITATIVCASNASSSSRCGMARYRFDGFGPATDRCPRGGKRHASAIASASTRESTCGTITPIAPTSSARVRWWWSCDGTRTSGVIPAAIAPVQSNAVVSKDVAVCSRST